MTEQIEYFQNELGSLRNSVEDFSRAYPGVASELQLSAGQSADPHVEQLLQSFAWLTGQLRLDMDQRRQEIPNHLLMSLYPHLLTSIPCMTVMEANILSDGVNFVNGYTLEKGRLFSSWSSQHRGTAGDEKKPVECRMQCAYDTPMWPLNIDDITIKSKNAFEFLEGDKRAKGIVSVNFSNFGTDPIYECPISAMRFFVADPYVRTGLHQLLSNNLYKVYIRSGDKVIDLPDAAINWLGFEEGHNVLPQPEGTHRAYRLLMEYFYFPEKFYFFDVKGLDVSSVAEDFELIFVFDEAGKLQGLNKDSLKINSFPAINLFPASFKPIQLDYSRYEYRIIADESQYGQSEVHSVDQIRVIASDGTIRNVNPWLGATVENNLSAENHIETVEKSTLHYVTRLVAPMIAGKEGCDTMITLYDSELSPAQPVDQTISTKGVCNNRDLPESLRIGDSLKLLGAGAMVEANILSRPTQFRGADLNGQSMSRLLSQLQLNQLSIADSVSDKTSLKRLKQLLKLYCDSMSPSHQKQIDGIMEIHSELSVRHMGKESWRGHYRGTSVTVKVDEKYFDGANPLLLGEVLSYFFGLYTTLDHFVQLKIISYQREGVWKQWPPRIGERIIL